MKYFTTGTLFAYLLLASSIAFAQGSVYWPVGPAGSQETTRTLFKSYGNYHVGWNDCDMMNFHSGIDICPYDGNIDVRAAKSGYIFHIDYSISGEYTVVIVDNMTVSTHGWAYLHLENPGNYGPQDGWGVGDFVNTNDLISEMSSATPTQHMHFSWSKKIYSVFNGSDVNPLDHLYNANSLEWVWNRTTSGFDVLMYYPHPESVENWPPNSTIFNEMKRPGNDLYGAIDILYGYSLEAIGVIGNPAFLRPLNPQNIKWQLLKYVPGDGWSYVFNKYVVDFSGLLGQGGETPDKKRYKLFYFSLSDFYLAGLLGNGLVSCISNCGDATGWLDPGISNIDWDCWQTNANLSGAGTGTALVPSEALYSDEIYQIRVISFAHDETEHEFCDRVIVDNFYPYVESVTVTNNDQIIFTGEYETPENPIPNVTERTLVSTYYRRTGSHYLEVDVEFSEPVMVDDIWIEGVAGDMVNWSSSMKQVTTDSKSSDGDFFSSYSFISDEIAPEGYIGRIVLSIDAHDRGHRENQLDSDPVTIPFPHNPVTIPPHNGDVRSPFCYEPGIATFEWNVARYAKTSGTDAVSGRRSTSLSPEIYLCNVTELLNESLNENVPMCTRGPLEPHTGYRGYCTEYAGFWVYGYWKDPDTYNKIYLIYPNASTDSGWDYLPFTFEMAYGHQTGMYPHTHYPYSAVHSAVSTYSDGNYCWVVWNDYLEVISGHTYGEGHLTCISALSCEMRTVNFPAIGGFTANTPPPLPVGDEVRYEECPLTEYYYYNPYSPEFFPEENPDVERNCSSSVDIAESTQSSVSLQDQPLAVSCNNPIRSGNNLEIVLESVPEAGLTAIRLYDLSGRCVISSEEQVSPGQNTVSMPVSDLPVGMYSIHVEVGNILLRRKTLIL